VTKEEWKAFLTHVRLLDLRDSYVVLSGSFPRGVSIDAYRQIITLVQSRGAKAVLDTDGPALKLGLEARLFAMKPNLNELRRLTGMALRSDRTVLAAAAHFHRTGIEIVLVSMGCRGLLMVSATHCYRAVPPTVRVRNTVGAGDSAVAGFVCTHAGGKDFGRSCPFRHRRRDGGNIGAGQSTLPVARRAAIGAPRPAPTHPVIMERDDV
jgi:fructose-1-phosphate kinase PfkB-like protein